MPFAFLDGFSDSAISADNGSAYTYHQPRDYAKTKSRWEMTDLHLADGGLKLFDPGSAPYAFDCLVSPV